MQLPNTRGQQQRDFTYDASGTIAAGGTAQLIVPEHKSRSYFLFENTSDTDMYLEIGGPRATATISNGKVTSIAVANAGFGFTEVPLILFLGGGNTGWNMSNPTLNSPGQPTWPAPAKPAQAHCVMTGSAPNKSIASFVVDDGGSGYVNAPYVFISNSENDPFGCAVPSSGVGLLIKANGGSYTNNGIACTTDAISVYCATTSKSYTFKFMT